MNNRCISQITCIPLKGAKSLYGNSLIRIRGHCSLQNSCCTIDSNHPVARNCCSVSTLYNFSDLVYSLFDHTRDTIYRAWINFISKEHAALFFWHYFLNHQFVTFADYLSFNKKKSLIFSCSVLRLWLRKWELWRIFVSGKLIRVM